MGSVIYTMKPADNLVNKDNMGIEDKCFQLLLHT